MSDCRGKRPVCVEGANGNYEKCLWARVEDNHGFPRIPPRKLPDDDEPAPSAFDVQEGGDHYKKFGEHQPFKVLSRWLTADELRGFAKGTAIAYLARERDKGGRQDIKKAMHTLQLYLELTEGEE